MYSKLENKGAKLALSVHYIQQSYGSICVAKGKSVETGWTEHEVKINCQLSYDSTSAES